MPKTGPNVLKLKPFGSSQLRDSAGAKVSLENHLPDPVHLSRYSQKVPPKFSSEGQNFDTFQLKNDFDLKIDSANTLFEKVHSFNFPSQNETGSETDFVKYSKIGSNIMKPSKTSIYELESMNETPSVSYGVNFNETDTKETENTTLFSDGKGVRNMSKTPPVSYGVSFNETDMKETENTTLFGNVEEDLTATEHSLSVETTTGPPINVDTIKGNIS